MSLFISECNISDWEDDDTTDCSQEANHYSGGDYELVEAGDSLYSFIVHCNVSDYCGSEHSTSSECYENDNDDDNVEMGD